MTYFFVDYLGQIKWREKHQVFLNETQICFSEKSNKMDNSVVRLINENKKDKDTDCWYQEWKREHNRRSRDIKGLIENEMSINLETKMRCTNSWRAQTPGTIQKQKQKPKQNKTKNYTNK